MAPEKRIHYYHADTTALGGHIHTPIEQMIPEAAPLSLPPVGGYAVARTERYRLEGIVSFEMAYTQVAGSVSRKNGAWTTLASSVVEGLNILDVIVVDRVVSQIATEHPREGYDPKVTFIGTQFQNVKIGGYAVEPVLNLNLCQQAVGPDGFPKTCLFEDQQFLATVEKQYRDLTASKNIPAWVRERYTWDNAQRARRGNVVCSLVSQVNGQFPGNAYGNILEIPEIGRIFLGELLVDHNSFRVIAMRCELGCVTGGDISVGTSTVEGRTWP
ncbi:MAG TPA: hypothetical protein VFA90_14015 [Terriglobales bacterium]|nr:hypothetical protein [Terriglobales bacterium]